MNLEKPVKKKVKVLLLTDTFLEGLIEALHKRYPGVSFNAELNRARVLYNLHLYWKCQILKRRSLGYIDEVVPKEYHEPQTRWSIWSVISFDGVLHIEGKYGPIPISQDNRVMTYEVIS